MEVGCQPEVLTVSIAVRLLLDIVDTSSSKNEVSTKPGQAQPAGYDVSPKL